MSLLLASLVDVTLVHDLDQRMKLSFIFAATTVYCRMHGCFLASSLPKYFPLLNLTLRFEIS